MYVDNDKGEYEIFAVLTIDVTPGRSRFLNLNALRSADRSTRAKALQTLMDRSLHDVMIDVSEEDQLLLLITCTGDDEERLLVVARRLR